MKIVNDDFRNAEFKQKADLVILDPPHDQYFEDLFFYIDENSKKDAIKIIIDSDKNIIKYCNENIERFSFFMSHDYIWHIGNKVNPYRQFDLIAIFDYDKSKFNYQSDGFSNVLRIKSERFKGTKNLKHPHQKPYKFYYELIKHFSREGDLILDFFLGSGLIIQVCNDTGRKINGCEINKDIFNKIDYNIYDKRNELQLSLV